MVSNKKGTLFERVQAKVLENRLREARRFIQVVAGPRQVGKTTLVEQVLGRIKAPHIFASADEPTLETVSWLAAQWDRARLAAANSKKIGAILILDEVQKIPNWAETVKRLWDEDTRSKIPLKVVLLGSAPLLVQNGLTESLAGRFEQIRLSHWSYEEMQKAFGFNLEDYLYYGGYPGAALLKKDPARWRRYILDSLVETTLSRDVLLMTRVDKPALMRRLFELGCRYSGQILSYTKILGQLQDAGNTTTLAHYLDLLAGAGMVMGVQKYAGQAIRQRGSIPKFQVLNTALLTAQSGLSISEARVDGEFRGRLVESAVGAHLANAAVMGEGELFYWREGNSEVDFVIRSGRVVVGIEVKSGRAPVTHSGMSAFALAFKPTRMLMVGGDGIPLEEFLTRPVSYWLKSPKSKK